MSAQISFNPVLTTNAAGSFNVSSLGYIQGTALNDPSVRNYLAGGVLATTETLPMWGGVGISENIPSATSIANTGGSLGGAITRATSLTQTASNGLTGFSVFDQNHAMVSSPQSPVPLAGTGMMVNFYRLGSGARIAVACDPLLASLEGGIIGQQVSWDFANQLLVPYEASAFTISSGTYVTGTGVISLVLSTSSNFSAGDAAILSSLTGTGAYATLNGTWTVLTAVGTAVTLQGPVGAGAATITGGSLTLGSGTASALAVKVLDVQVGNSMTVAYNATTGFATWNRSGSTAIILI